MLVSGEIDALITARAPHSFVKGNPDIIRLFPNYDEVERKYYSKHKLFPIMHTVILRKDFYAQYPWAAISLYNAFVESKENCIKRMISHDLVALPISLPWISREIEKTQELMLNNFWGYGLENCWNEIDAMCQYSYEQGLSPRRVDPKELFAKNVMNMSNTTRI